MNKIYKIVKEPHDYYTKENYGGIGTKYILDDKQIDFLQKFGRAVIYVGREDALVFYPDEIVPDIKLERKSKLKKILKDES